MPVEEEVVSIFAGVKGFLDAVEVSQVRAFEQEALRDLRSNHADLLKEIAEQKVISEETETKLMDFYQKFQKRFCETAGRAA